MESLPLLIVDAANVVGSVPDGWWRDRRGATVRLRDALAPLAVAGLPAAGLPGPVEVVLVAEGAARGVPSVATVRVVDAPGSGDDQIVALVSVSVSAEAEVELGAGRPVWVVTADRGLRERVTALGAHILGPRTVR